MSEENPHGAHPVAVSNHYAQVPQTHGGVYHPGVAPSSSTHPSYGYREGGPGYSMNGIAGGTHPFHATMPATPRGPSQNVAPAHWPSNYYQAPVSQETIQPAHAPASYPTPSEHSGSWKVPPSTSFLRSQSSSQDQNFSHAQNYSLNYSRPHHNPMEPSAAPSPPNPYPGSPRTPVSAHQTAGSNGIPQPQPFRPPPNPPNKRPLTPSTAAPLGLSLENAAHRAEPASRYTESSMLPRNQVRGHMASPLGPPTSSSGAHRGSFNNTRRNNENYGSQSVEDGGKGPERRVSTPTTRRNHDTGYDSADEEASKRIKLERNSREPSISLSPRTVRIDHGAGSDDRSPSFSGSATKDLKTGGPEMQGKKKGQPVFRDANGNEYYENELVPPGVPIPDGWQRGTGKQTKDLLLPHMKDGISVNPEWGFTAGGKARQRLPQACKNCRAKKIRCVESDYDERVCQHCHKMRITCQRYEKEDEKKKKRASQSHDYVKSESNSGERSGSIVSDSGHDTKMNAPVKSGGSKKRKSSDEGPGGVKRLNRGAGSRANSIGREQHVNIVLANTSVTNRPAIHSAPLESERPPLFPQSTMDAHATIPGDQASHSRKEYLREIRDHNQTHERAHSLSDASPLSSYSTVSPSLSVSSLVPPGNGGYLESNSGYSLDHRFSESPVIHALEIPRRMGEDPRHHDLPGPARLQHLVEAYFANIFSQTYAFLHKPSFIANWDNHSPVLLFSMCAVAARFAGCGREEEQLYERRARELILDGYDKYSLEMVQSLVHMGLHDFGSNNGSKAWMFAGMAVRMGAALNMNLESRKKDKRKDAIVQECTRRTYWSYYLMDRFNSYGVARPFLTQDHDCHIQLPCNQPSFIAGKYAATEHLLGPNPYDPTVGTKNMGAMAYLVRVVGIWGNILKQIHLSAFQMHPSEESGSKMGAEFEGFIGKLENWRKTLPRGLEYSNENLAGQISVGTTGAFVTMHVMWHTAMAYVHRYVRTVGIPKDFIEKNIPREVIIESIRKAFVHADAVLQIMVHVREQRSLAAKKGETVTVNAPFLGQAISDACNITVIRAKEVHGGPRGATEQRRRVRAGLEWLRELRRYWKPIESMYQKLKKKYRELERSASRPPSSAHMVPTPESVDSGLQPGSTYPVDPTNYSAEPTFTSAGMAQTMNQDPQQFSQFVDFLSYTPTAMGGLNYFGEAFASDMSSYMLSEYARNEGGFPDLYIAYSDGHMTSVSAPYDFMSSNPTMSAEMMQPMQLDPPAVPPPPPPPPRAGSFQAEQTDSDDSDDEEDSGGSGEKSRGSINATYFDPTAVRDGALPDSASDSSGHSRRASGVGNTISSSKVDNPMDLLHLVNQDDINTISASLQGRQNENDKFTGPNGAAAPENNDLGGQPNLDNSGGADPADRRLLG